MLYGGRRDNRFTYDDIRTYHTGDLFRKKQIISPEQSDGISSLTVNLAWPCLVIDAMQMEFSVDVLKDSGYILAVAAVLFVIVIAGAFPLAALLGLSGRKKYITAFMLMFGNTGFIGIPVVKALYGSEAVFLMAMLEMINDVLIFTIGIILIQMSSGAKLRLEPKKFLSPGLIGVLIGLALFFARIQLPETLGGSIELIGNITTPLAMFLIGYQLGGLKLKEIVGDLNVYAVCFVKLAAIPVITLIVAKLLAGEFSLLEKVLVLSFAMPVGTVAAIFSQQYKGEVAFATKTVLLSTVFCIVTVPIFAIIMEI